MKDHRDVVPVLPIEKNKDGDFNNNKEENLMLLCELCHMYVNDTHKKAFNQGKPKAMIKKFIAKYHPELEKVKNQYLDRFDKDHTAAKQR